MQSLVYVSRSLLPLDNCDQLLEDMLTESVKRNTALGVTGLLIATPDFFAQVLEGQKADIDLVMASIHRDARHYEVRTLECSPISLRRYPCWGMARFDEANFGLAHLNPLLLACHEGRDARAYARLVRLLDLTSFNLSCLAVPGSLTFPPGGGAVH